MTSSPTAGRMEGPVHLMDMRVYYEDTDAVGVVYHARYLAFFERARSEFLRLLGIDHAAALAHLPEERLGFAVRRCEIDYKAPARLDDALTIQTMLTKLGAAYTDVRQQVLLDGQLIVEGWLRVAVIDGKGRPTRMPAPWRAAMAPLVVKEEA